jgi:hypothetical protein
VRSRVLPRLKLFNFRVDIHNPSTVNNVSANTTGVLIVIGPDPEIIPKEIRLPAALRKIFRPHSYVRARHNLTYSSYGTRGWEYNHAPKCDGSKRQRSKDYQPQKRVTLVLDKPISRFSKISSKGQCQASIGKRIIYFNARDVRIDIPYLAALKMMKRDFWKAINTHCDDGRSGTD